MDISLSSIAFIFDFDGTLVDSEHSIYQCFQCITKKLAPERMDYVKNILIGPPLKDTASEILGPKHQGSLDIFIKLFIEMHDEQVIQHTKPYPYVDQVLKKLQIDNIPMAIATNKRQAPTYKLLKHLNWEQFFITTKCSDSKDKNTTKEVMIKEILDSNLFKNAYFVGDTPNDGIAANINGLNFIKASYGYGKKQNWSSIKIFKEINSFSKILDLKK